MARIQSLALFAVAASLLAVCQGKPQFWVYKHLLVATPVNCSAHPVVGQYYGTHGVEQKQPVSVDSQIVFIVEKDGKAVTSVCPNTTYDLTVQFPEARAYFLTASDGSLQYADSAYGVPACTGAQYNNATAEEVRTTWTVPCCLSGAQAILAVTSAAGHGMPHHQATLGLALGPTCTKCSAPCPGDAAAGGAPAGAPAAVGAPSGAPAGTPAGNPAGTPAPPATPSPKSAATTATMAVWSVLLSAVGLAVSRAF